MFLVCFLSERLAEIDQFLSIEPANEISQKTTFARKIKRGYNTNVDAIQMMEMGLTARSAKFTSIICTKDKRGCTVYTIQKGRWLYEKMLSLRSAKLFIIGKKYRGELNNTKGQMIVEKDADFEVSNCQRLFL